MWRFREAILSEDSITTRYIAPENKIILDEKEVTIPYSTQDEITLSV